VYGEGLLACTNILNEENEIMASDPTKVDKNLKRSNMKMFSKGVGNV
jgi:hypothetical protein